MTLDNQYWRGSTDATLQFIGEHLEHIDKEIGELRGLYGQLSLREAERHGETEAAKKWGSGLGAVCGMFTGALVSWFIRFVGS